MARVDDCPVHGIRPRRVAVCNYGDRKVDSQVSTGHRVNGLFLATGGEVHRRDLNLPVVTPVRLVGVTIGRPADVAHVVEATVQYPPAVPAFGMRLLRLPLIHHVAHREY